MPSLHVDGGRVPVLAVLDFGSWTGWSSNDPDTAISSLDDGAFEENKGWSRDQPFSFGCIGSIVRIVVVGRLTARRPGAGLVEVVSSGGPFIVIGDGDTVQDLVFLPGFDQLL